jgi:hypothetical protein
VYDHGRLLGVRLLHPEPPTHQPRPGGAGRIDSQLRDHPAITRIAQPANAGACRAVHVPGAASTTRQGKALGATVLAVLPGLTRYGAPRMQPHTRRPSGPHHYRHVTCAPPVLLPPSGAFGTPGHADLVGFVVRGPDAGVGCTPGVWSGRLFPGAAVEGMESISGRLFRARRLRGWSPSRWSSSSQEAARCRRARAELFRLSCKPLLRRMTM